MTPTAPARTNEHPLDDVVWAALSGPHAHLARGDGETLRYEPDIAPFGAVRHRDGAAYAAAVARLDAGQTLAFVTPAPLPALEGAVEVLRAALHQMVLDNHVAIALYERIGFRTRRPMHFAVFRRAEA